MITDLDEETLDLDWFGVDMKGEIGHFATGGKGFLPTAVKASRENLDYLASYFRLLPETGTSSESQGFIAQGDFQSSTEKARYLRDFVQMGNRGLYSFDNATYRKRPTGYFLVVRPSFPLKVERLPADIQRLLVPIRFNGCFAMTEIIDEIQFK